MWAQRVSRAISEHSQWSVSETGNVPLRAPETYALTCAGEDEMGPRLRMSARQARKALQQLDAERLVAREELSAPFSQRRGLCGRKIACRARAR